jgi:predicted permease
MVQDVKYAVRLLWKSKAFTLTVLATLAICISANTVVFSVVNSVVLKPLPFQESDRILRMYNSYPNAGVEIASTGVPDYYDRLRDVTVFEEQALYNNPGLTIGETGSVQQVEGMAVTPSFFRLLRVKPKLGRVFTDDEGESGNQKKVILSYGLWQELYGGDRTVLGKDLRIYGNPHTIVGVMPEDFVFARRGTRLWRPLAFTQEDRSDDRRHSNNWEMIGRLKPGATLEQARQQIDALNAGNLNRFPQMKELLLNAGFHTRVVRLQDDVIRDIKRTLYLLWGGAIFVLLIGTVNVANLMMARGSARAKEMATRFALGAGPWRVTRQLLTESMLLAILSALLGILSGRWALRILDSLQLDRIPRGGEVVIDGTVILFILGLAVAVGCAIGVIPVFHGLRISLSSVFRGDERAGTGGYGSRILRRALVVVQLAFALILLTGAGLLLASFRHVLAVRPGFEAKQVVTGSIALPSVRYGKDADQRAFVQRALERLRALPGVVAAAAIDTIPFGDSSSDSVILAEGYQMKPGESLISPNQIVVTPDYFRVMKIPLIEGRFFEENDTEDSRRVVIVDDRLARKFWPNSSPIGRRMWQPGSPEGLIRPDEKAQWFTVVGVVGSTKLRALVDPDERPGAYYFPYTQTPRSGLTFALRTGVDATSLVSSMRRAVSELDSQLPLFDTRTMEERIAESLISRKSPMLLAIGFGGVAIFLAAVGIYGVLAYLVAQRTREIGIRLALGSSMERIFRMILKEGIVILAIGFSLGLAGTVAVGRYVESILYGVRPLDPIVIVSVTLTLGTVALIASILPAWRATRVDPVTALRQE